MAKKDPFDMFLDKNFPEGPRVKIAKPLGGERETSFDERRRRVEEERARGGAEEAQGRGSAAPQAEAAVEEPRRPGRPKSVKGPVVNVNFLLEVDAKQRLDRLKVDLYRSSVTDLIKEALHDLFVKYDVS